MNAKGWYSTKTLVNIRTSNTSATVVHRPTRFVDSQSHDDAKVERDVADVASAKEPPFALVPLRKRPFPRSPTEPTSPRKRTHAARPDCPIDNAEAAHTQGYHADAHKWRGCDQTDGDTSDDDDDSAGANGFGQSIYDCREEKEPTTNALFTRNDGDGDHNNIDDCDSDSDGIISRTDSQSTSQDCSDDAMGSDADRCNSTDKHVRSHNNTARHWSDDSDDGNRNDNDHVEEDVDDAECDTDSLDHRRVNMPTASDWKRSPAAATAMCLRAEERRLQMLCRVHEAVLRQTQAALDGVRFAIRRLERMHDQGA
nr:DNA topoisomerase 2 domain [Pandoravirus massiliensis]